MAINDSHSRRQANKIPVDIVSGPLGSGKTTTICDLIAPHYEVSRGLILVNDAGRMSEDARRLKHLEDRGWEIQEFSGTCACCAGREGLDTALEQLTSRSYDRMIFETSGLSNPHNVLGVFLNPKFRDAFDVQNVVHLLPARSLEYVKHAVPVVSGVAVANVIGSTFNGVGESLDPALISFCREHNKHASIKMIGPGSGSNDVLQGGLLHGVDRWNLDDALDLGVLQPSGSALYVSDTFAVHPEIAENRIREALEELSKSGIERAKGAVPQAQGGFIFDISQGALSYRPSERDRAVGVLFLAHPTMIPAESLKTIDPIVGMDSKMVTTAGSSVEDIRKKLFYDLQMARQSKPFVGGKILATYEAVDASFWTGWTLYQKTGDDAGFRMALPDYVRVLGGAASAAVNLRNQGINALGMLHAMSLSGLLPQYDEKGYSKHADSVLPDVERVLKQNVPVLLSRFDVGDYDVWNSIEGGQEAHDGLIGLVSIGKDHGLLSAAQTSSVAKQLVGVYDRCGDGVYSSRWRLLM